MKVVRYQPEARARQSIKNSCARPQAFNRIDWNPREQAKFGESKLHTVLFGSLIVLRAEALN